MTSSAASLTHPRLYFTPKELVALRDNHRTGFATVIHNNLINSADWCLGRPLRKEWIAPVIPDPIYENLSERFYAIMHDMAVMEHLACFFKLPMGVREQGFAAQTEMLHRYVARDLASRKRRG